MRKPGDPETLVEVIHKINERKKADIDKVLQEDINKVFERLQFKRNNKAVEYLKSAILISYKNHNISLKEILKQLEEKYACNPLTMQSIIQKYLYKAYNQQKNKKIYYEIFPEYCGDEPSPKHFIDYMVTYLKNIHD